MIILTKSLKAWGTDQFKSILESEIRQLSLDQLPLQQALTQSSYAVEGSQSITLLSSEASAGVIQVKVGVFFHGIIAGCSCADDPTPIDTINEYCEMAVSIDKREGSARIELLP